MRRDLTEHFPLLGMTRSRVTAMLGAPEKTLPALSIDRYILGAETDRGPGGKGGTVLFCLDLRYSADGCVAEVAQARDYRP